VPRLTTTIDLPSISAGTRRYLTVHRYGQAGARPKAYFQAALHADEWPGLLVLHHLTRLLDVADADGRIAGEVLVVPFANPIGLAQQVGAAHAGRYALDGSGDFNRGWPDLSVDAAGRLRGRLSGDPTMDVTTVREVLREAAGDVPYRSETEALRAHLLQLSIDSDLVFDVHCDGAATLHLYGSERHDDKLLALADELGVPVILFESEPSSGPFDEANSGPWWKLRRHVDGADRLPPACFAATLELRGQADVSDALAEQDARGLLRYLIREGVVTGDAGPAPGRQGDLTPLEGVDVVCTPVGGIVTYKVALGARVEAGQVVAEVVDPAAPDPDQARTELCSRASGIFFAHKLNRLVVPGDRVCKVAGQTPLPHRLPGNLLEA